MTFNTGNPIGSTDARDLSDNAENFDKALGTLDATWTDRLGVTRDSFEGRLAKGSFYRVGTFAAGYTLTNMRQTLEYSGHEYSWAGTFPKVVAAGATPATSGGIGAGAWVDRTDVTLRGELSGNSGSGIVAFFRGVTNSVKIWIFTKLSKTIDVEEFGVIEGITTDQSVAMQKAVDYAGSVGGVLRWPANTIFYGRIDFSNITKRFIFDAQGSVFAPAINTVNEVFYAIRSSSYPVVTGEFSKLPVTFIDTNITSKLLSATSDADPDGYTNYGVNFICTSADWVRSSWQYGKIASYYGYYHQYGVFYDCTAGASVFSGGTAGMLLDGNTASEASNENRIYGIKLFSNKNGLVIKGGVKNRIYTPTVQDTRYGGQGGILVTADSSGFGADGTEIHGVYSEINHGVPCIHVGVASNTSITGVEFVSVGEYIDTDTCYNISLKDINGYVGGAITLRHPPSSTDTASAIVTGGNVKPTLTGLAHNGKSVLSISQPAIQNYRNDSILGSTEAPDQANIPTVFIPDWYGVKTKVSKGVSTALCAITLDTASVSQYRVVVSTLDLWLWDDADYAGQFGYSGHSQRYTVMISTNASGNPQVSIVKESSGIDVGIETTFQSVGDVAVTHSVSGNMVTFYASWTGSGTGGGLMALQSIAYCLRGAGTNSFYMTRL